MGVAKKYFGAGFTQFLSETRQHSNTAFTYINYAGKDVRTFTLASCIVNMENLKDQLQSGEESLNSMEAGEPAKTPITLMPATILHMYERIGKAAAGNTQNAKLERLFAGKLSECKALNAARMNRLEKLGMLQQIGSQLQKSPDFEQTGLLDDPKVRMAYDIIANNARVAPPAFEAALRIGKLLTQVPQNANPAAVAAALIDVSLPLTPHDMAIFKDHLHAEVLGIIERNSVNSRHTANSILEAPAAFRQIVVAHAIFIIDESLKNGRQGLRLARQGAGVSEAELNQNLMEFVALHSAVTEAVLPVFGATGAPELESVLAEKMNDLNEFLRQYPAPKPFNPPKSGGFGRPSF